MGQRGTKWQSAKWQANYWPVVDREKDYVRPTLKEPLFTALFTASTAISSIFFFYRGKDPNAPEKFAGQNASILKRQSLSAKDSDLETQVGSSGEEEVTFKQIGTEAQLSEEQVDEATLSGRIMAPVRWLPALAWSRLMNVGLLFVKEMALRVVKASVLWSKQTE